MDDLELHDNFDFLASYCTGKARTGKTGFVMPPMPLLDSKEIWVLDFDTEEE